MKKEEFSELLEKKVVILDGAMGTMLQKAGFGNGCHGELNIKSPGLVKSIHKGYADAGADCALTNTFGANRASLDKYGLGEKTIEINRAAIRNVREAAPGCLITRLEPGGAQRNTLYTVDHLDRDRFTAALAWVGPLLAGIPPARDG